ncbi:MAG: YcaO-like family protein [Ilumatobacter sp.]|jgi:ribosomal protein S12 methylthiotransferase accessory factor|uniref:YcaO-like family protein n=1 Tax=Ilumatobacter sp. TaxID=1967498 RepID=UPI002A2A25C9|nr:YcaO-like family protein [Ilumatobacter sp.]MBT5864760.1 YcaO-like family protein [Ilumatobacter sp.]MDG0975590.1 YcaO-like family protein [Ilumatobacter sp.]MDG1391013.1 YcaO-like family protein [Ilumatobacter sp.]
MTLNLDHLLAVDEQPLRTLVTSSGLRSRETSDLRGELSQHLGAYGITRVAHLTGFDRIGLPVHMAIKPQGRTLASGSGKGVSPDASWVSAVMECCEQAVWEHLEIASVVASQNELRWRGVVTVDGSLCPQAKGSLWTPDVPIRWTPSWDIIAGTEVWVPDGLVAVALGGDKSYRPFITGSNGLASGAHVLEAILSGLMEVVERDGMTLTTHVGDRPHLDGMARLRAVEPSVADRIEAAGLRLEVVDATTEIGIPIVVAYLHDVPGGRTGSFKGAGASLSASAALVRAVTEAAQGRCLIVSGARDDMFESQRAAATSSTVSTPTSVEGVFDNDVNLSTGSVEGDLERAATMLRSAGFSQILVIRHTSPDDPVQVVRVIVPGLEGYMFSYAAVGERGQAWVDDYRLETA